jgi:gamma-glutamyltranspeptidase/glutathione hydrolase
MAFAPTTVAIAADSPAVVHAGIQIARSGGNAVDIAVASALAATVSEVILCSLGGSAFFMVGMAGLEPKLIDGADAMPSVARKNGQLAGNWRSVRLDYGGGIEVGAGHASVAVPGMLAAAELAWRTYGRLPWSEVVAPASELAKSPVPAGTTMARWLAIAGRQLFYQQQASRESFFVQHDQPVCEGQLFKIPHLDSTFAEIQRHGATSFYTGDIARAIVTEMQNNGGFITQRDLAAYQAQVRDPLLIQSRGYQLALNPPPAIGGTAVGLLLSWIDKNFVSSLSAAERTSLHARAQTQLVRLRATDLISPDFCPQAARNLLHNLPALQCPHTTHFSVITGDGSMVAVTMSNGYGSGITIPGTGIACNNSLGEPELNPHGYYSSPPGSRMISNMAPTLARHANGQRIAIGTPGASRISTALCQTWCRHVLEEMSLEEAVEAPRLHIEPVGENLWLHHEPGIDTQLLGTQYSIRAYPSSDMFFGAIKLCALDENGRLQAVADRRRQGATEIFHAS